MIRRFVYLTLAFLANASTIFAATSPSTNLYTRPTTLDTNALNASIHRHRMGTLLIEAGLFSP